MTFLGYDSLYKGSFQNIKVEIEVCQEGAQFVWINVDDKDFYLTPKQAKKFAKILKKGAKYASN